MIIKQFNSIELLRSLLLVNRNNLYGWYQMKTPNGKFFNKNGTTKHSFIINSIDSYHGEIGKTFWTLAGDKNAKICGKCIKIDCIRNARNFRCTLVFAIDAKSSLFLMLKGLIVRGHWPIFHMISIFVNSIIFGF